MAEEETKPAEVQDDENALETPDSGQDSTTSTSPDTSQDITDATSSGTTTAAQTPPPAEKKSGGLKQLLRKFNIYLLIFIFILILAALVLAIAYFQSKSASTTATLKTQTLTESTLQQIAASDSTVGSSQQVLNVQSSAVFAGQVLIRNGLQVAGNLNIGGTVSLNDITVSGTAQLGQAEVSNNLSVSGNSAIQGTETIAKTLQVGGSGSFSGSLSAPQITTTSFQLNGDLLLTHHLVSGGGTPGHSAGPALGSGGSATVSGSDIAGTATINTGSGTSAGCFITINFTSSYANIPHVLLTPVGASAGGLSYYVTDTNSSFSICDATSAPTGASFGFNYFVAD